MTRHTIAFTASEVERVFFAFKGRPNDGSNGAAGPFARGFEGPDGVDGLPVFEGADEEIAF